MAYLSQAARDSQEFNYGTRSYWEYLERTANRHYDYFMEKNQPRNAEKMLMQSLWSSLSGNDGI